MKLNNISFPYPVLRFESDDIIPKLDESCVSITCTTELLYYIFNIKLSFENRDIMSLIEEGKAEFTCEVDCPKTVWRNIYCSNKSDFSIKIARKELAGNISFSCFVSVKQPIKNYVNSGFNDDYEGYSFEMEVGDILVGFPQINHHVDVKYDKLKFAGSFMKIHEDLLHEYVNFNFDNEKIEINLPQDMFKQYQNDLKTNFAETMHASLAFNALTCALYELPNCDENLQWVNALMYRITHEEDLIEHLIDEESREIKDVPGLAIKLLKDPYRRLFNNLSNFNTNDFEE